MLDLVENKYWEYNHKPLKESNKKAFTDVMNANFPNDVQRNWKQVRNKLNKMKNIYKIKKKKIEVTSAPPSDWPWFELLTIIFLVLPK